MFLKDGSFWAMTFYDSFIFNKNTFLKAIPYAISEFHDYAVEILSLIRLVVKCCYKNPETWEKILQQQLK